MAQSSLPPGFRFHPTDVELVVYYLKRRIMGKKLIVEAISEVDLYKYGPWDLPDKSCLQSKDLEWFFFCPRDKKYPKGSRTNRGTPNGYWKTSGKDRLIELNSRVVGSKKTLIFHEGKPPKGNRTDWVMYEYKMEDDSLVSAGFSKDDYVLCKIFKKSGLCPRIGEQYGAPFNEDEWENLEANTNLFPLMSSSELVNSAAVPNVQHASTAIVAEELPIQHSSATTSVEDLGNITADCALQDLPSQQSAKSSVDVNYNANGIENASPEIDGILLEELSMFLNDSPYRDIPSGEHSGLPPMSELESQALEINTSDLYDELAGLARFGEASNFDGFCAGNVGIPENNYQRTYSEPTIGDDDLGLDDLLASDATLTPDLPVPQYYQYPLDQSAYNGQYDDGATLPATVAANDSLPTSPSFFHEIPYFSNNGDFPTGLVDFNYSAPAFKAPYS